MSFGSGQATTVAPVPVDELYENADIVAAIVITEGELIEASQQLCGALYKGRVLKAFKGASDDEAIVFGYFVHYEVGGTYLMFLTKPGKIGRWLGSTNAGLEADRQKALEECRTVRIGHESMHSGYGVMRIYAKGLIEQYSVVKVSSKYVPLPEALEVTPAATTELDRFSGYVWVSFNELAEYLMTLSGKAHNKSPKRTQ